MTNDPQRVFYREEILVALPDAAYLFDNDGLLADTESVWFAAYQEWLKQYGAEHRLEVHRTMMGQSAHGCIEILQKAYPRFVQGPNWMKELLDARLFWFRWAMKKVGLKPMPGADDFLRVCKAAKIPLGLVTSSQRHIIEQQLEKFGWKGVFQTIVTAEDVERHKPAPDPYQKAAQNLGVDIKDCVAFEDAATGITSAHTAGAWVVFIRDTRFNDFDAPEATVTATSLTRLISEDDLL